MPIIVQQDSHGASGEVPSCFFENEKELEDVLAAHPNLLKEVHEDEIVFIHRQVILPDCGRIDLLLITSDALPVITEVKLGKNKEAQRKIVGQIFDYVSALTLLDLYQLDELVDGKLQEVIETLSTRSQSSDLWKDFNGHLKSAETRFILAVDEAPESLLRIMEFLCRHTSLDVRLFEIHKFKQASGECTFVSTLKMGPREKELESHEGVVHQTGANPAWAKFYESMKVRIAQPLRARQGQDPYRYAIVYLNNGCQVRYDILLRESVVRIAFKSVKCSPEIVRKKVEETYPNLERLLDNHTLSISPVKENVIWYFTSISLATPDDLNSDRIVNEASSVFMSMFDKFSSVATNLC